MRIAIFLFASFFSASLLGQTAADSADVVKQVDSLIQSASAHLNKRNFDKAFEINAAAEKLALEHLGPASAAYGSCCNNRGRANYIKKDYPEAEKWLLKAQVILEKALGKEHPVYAEHLTQLGMLYRGMGQYEKSELLYLEAKPILEKTLGKEHPKYTSNLNNLANLCTDLGNYEKAERYHLEVIAIRGKTLGKEHSSYALSLSNLAYLYLMMGRYEKAEPLFLEVTVLQKKTIGAVHPYYALSLDNLAYLYTVTGRSEKAEPIYLEAITILEKSTGKQTPRYASSLQNLANLYVLTGRYEAAEPLYLEAKAIQEKLIGNEHPSYTQNLSNMANLYEHQEREAESERLLAELSTLQQARLLKSTAFLSERELANYTATFQHGGDKLGAYMLARQARNSPVGTLPGLGFDHALFSKGFLLTAVGRLNALSSGSPEASDLRNRFKGYRRDLAAKYGIPIGEQKEVAELEEKANAIEKELARTVVGYADAARQVKWQEVQTVLKPGETAIEFVHFKVMFPKETDSTMYAALILLPGVEQPIFVPLFEEKQLEALLKTSGGRRSDYVNSLYSPAVAQAKAGTAQKTGGKSLFELVWQPIEKALVGSPAFDKSTAGEPAVDLSKAAKKTIYFSPSGLLHRINLAAIPTSKTANLGDRFRFVELGSTRSLAEGMRAAQLVVPASFTAQAESGEVLLWGGIQYDMDSTAINAANAKLKTDLARTRGDLGFEKTDSTSRLACESTDGCRGGSWEYLPWTEKEINAIAPILTAAGLKPTSRKGFSATEDVFKTIGSNANVGRVSNPSDVSNPSNIKNRSPRILHIATHGYFFPDPKTADNGRKMLNEVEPVFKISDHPMIRSGLLLAGANQAWKTGKPLRPDLEDGILTAYEISQMDLSNTELVVLSACETGLGDIQGNEGVYGLQRAFKIAGAKYLIMSLWQVPDFQTQELMTAFYQKWLAEKLSLPDAFRAAQQMMREKYEHPYFWAGFVLVE